MASLRLIRSRLRSIQNTKQIMRAMQLVSGSKFKRAQGKLLQARDVLGFLDGMLQRVLTASPALDHPPTHLPAFGGPKSALARLAKNGWGGHPLCTRHDEGASALVIFTSDTGLCGSYNTNLIQLAESYLRRESLTKTQVIYIGKKGYRYFTKRGFAAAESYLGLVGRPDLTKAEAIGRSLMERFLTNRSGPIHLLYSQFASSTVYRPTILQWLPIQLATRHSPLVTQQATDYIFEPSPRRVFEDLLPRWALATFQLVMLEAFTSEHSARMIAMKNATDNAEDLLKTLTMQRNKIRQASITKEISEIVGTAEALK